VVNIEIVIRHTAALQTSLFAASVVRHVATLGLKAVSRTALSDHNRIKETSISKYEPIGKREFNLLQWPKSSRYVKTLAAQQWDSGLKSRVLQTSDMLCKYRLYDRQLLVREDAQNTWSLHCLVVLNSVPGKINRFYRRRTLFNLLRMSEAGIKCKVSPLPKHHIMDARGRVNQALVFPS
jgi:hypothetical protein